MRIRAAVLLISFFSVASFADEPATAQKTRRLGPVTWNPSTHTLAWSVETYDADRTKVEKTESFTIELDQAVMSQESESRRFSTDEAVTVRQLFDLVSKYAAESTLWWDNGQGEPLDGSPVIRPERKQPRQERLNLVHLRTRTPAEP